MIESSPVLHKVTAFPGTFFLAFHFFVGWGLESFGLGVRGLGACELRVGVVGVEFSACGAFVFFFWLRVFGLLGLELHVSVPGVFNCLAT